MILKLSTRSIAFAFLTTITFSATSHIAFGCCGCFDDDDGFDSPRDPAAAPLLKDLEAPQPPRQPGAPLTGISVAQDGENDTGNVTAERQRKEQEERRKKEAEEASSKKAQPPALSSTPAAAAASLSLPTTPAATPTRLRAASLHPYEGDPVTALQPRFTAEKIGADLWELVNQNDVIAKAVTPYILKESDQSVISIFHHNDAKKEIRLSINGKRGAALIKY
ncbi:MAG: hypothetical protein FJX71_00635 [Alphaproteobacteria bacterium]|nr:hypothetical protein [Alphaproteobacteria bacterium]